VVAITSLIEGQDIDWSQSQ